MQKFQETSLANTSSATPVNLNKPIPNIFQLKRMLNTTQVININKFFLLETGVKSEVYVTAMGLEIWLNGGVFIYELSGCEFKLISMKNYLDPR